MKRSKMNGWLIPTLSLALVIGMAMTACAGGPPKPNLQQSTLIESLGPDGVRVKAAGEGKDAGKALDDARLSAIIYAKDQIITTPEERAAFAAKEGDFYANAKQFISSEDADLLSRVKQPNGKIRVEKIFVVNPMKVQTWLSDRAIIKAQKEVAGALGNPTIMVLPEEAAKGQQWTGHAATAIQHHLTTKRYEVKIPDQAQNMQQLTGALRDLKGHLDDVAALIAMQVGADVYIKYNVDLTARQVGSDTVGKASATVNAFETTTARALGSATGFSRERSVSDRNILVEEAIVDAIDKVLNNVDAYWKEDAVNGIQYRLIFAGDFTTQKGRASRDAIVRSLREISKTTKPILSTDKTQDFQIWGTQKDYFAVKDALQDAYTRNFKGAAPAPELVDEQLFSKMLMFKVE